MFNFHLAKDCCAIIGNCDLTIWRYQDFVQACKAVV